MSQLATKSDEALLLVMMENSIDHWMAEWNDPEHKNMDSWPKPKYTCVKNQAKKYKGWSQEGIGRFWYYMTDFVPNSREGSKDVEENLRKAYSTNHGLRRSSDDEDEGDYQFVSLLESDNEEDE